MKVQKDNLTWGCLLSMAVIALLVLTGPALADKADSSSVIIKKGLNLNKYHKMIEEVRANPSYADVEFRAEAESEDVVYHSTAKIGPFSIAGEEYGQTREHILHLGVPIELQAEVESPVDRIEPVELALAGMADCITGTIALHAVVNNIEVDRIRTTIRAPLNLLVLVGLEDLDRRDEIYGKISVDVELEGPNLTEADRAFLEQEAKRSPAFNLIALAHDIEPSLSIRQDESLSSNR
jgi:uncharacterized OsmC-like protein